MDRLRTGGKVGSGENAGRRAARRQAAGAPARLPIATEGVVAIAGIGASAGGLEALEQFLGRVPEGSGLAFVVIQHLDPTREGIMPELIQRVTRMSVAQVKDRTKVEPNCVYVIPPNKDISILRGVLHLLAPSSPRGMRLPIDFFFRSLADDQLTRSAGVILSGMGTDGTQGLKAIKEHGGVVLVQDPATAKFDSMPHSAIGTGLADVVAPAEELPDRLLALLRHTPRPSTAEPILEAEARNALDKIVIVLRSRSHHDFSLYKKSTLYRRIERRMRLHRIDKIATYVRYLQENPQEQDLVFNELLIGVTSFFRDPAAWKALRDKAIPALLGERPKGGQLRAWSVGCSTGEEAYSLAMVFKEALEKVRPKASFSLQIFATDLDQRAVEKTRQGVFPANVASSVSPERLSRFFVKDEGGSYRVGNEIRETVIVAPHNVIRDPPFTKLDLVACRNLLIYLEPELQRRLLPLLHYSLNPGGILFLGSSETVGAQAGLFAPIDAKLRLYRRKESAARPEVDFPSSYFPAAPVTSPPASDAKSAANLQTLADELILRQFGPAGALVSDRGEIFYVSGRTGKYLEPPAGKANWNVFAMAREGLRNGLASAVQKAARQKRSVTVHGLTVGTNGGAQGVDLTVRPLEEPAALRGMLLVIFRDAAAVPTTRATAKHGRRGAHETHLAELQREARQLREGLQTTQEEMQTSQEELRSANEELQSTNEELQSMNEELTTSKEEMQSMNEELQTVNGELQAKLDELSRANNDMKNLLNSTEIATLFLDSALLVRRFTSQAGRLIKLIPGDVGRPVTDIASDLIYSDLAGDLREVLRTLVPSERQITTRDGRWFTARVMPYRTLEDVIDGVVITFAEITDAKVLEGELRSSRERFGALIENLPPSLSIVDEGGRTVPRRTVLARISDAKSADVASWKVVLGADVPDREAPP